MGWSKKYKRSIDCNNPKGFSQKAHCAGRKKRESVMSSKLEELVGKPITEAQFDEAAGKKDACYYKVKARYDVWPSAYASGALVKCRKVGAKNWGNKSKKEGVNEGKFRVHFDLNPDASPAQRLGLMSVEVTAKDKKEAEKMVASKFVGGMKLIKKGKTKKLKEGGPGSGRPKGGKMSKSEKQRQKADDYAQDTMKKKKPKKFKKNCPSHLADLEF